MFLEDSNSWLEDSRGSTGSWDLLKTTIYTNFDSMGNSRVPKIKSKLFKNVVISSIMSGWQNCQTLKSLVKTKVKYNIIYHKKRWTKVLFTDRCRWQNFRPSLLRLVNNCVESIYKMQQTRTKVLPSATVGE